jgi:uncharacterized Zn-binding protein involved in type VI secretion
MNRNVVLAGDPISSGGYVLVGEAGRIRINGVPIAGIGGRAWCSVCRSTGGFARSGGPHRRGVFGAEEAFEDDLVLCQCAVAPRLVALAVTQGAPHYTVDDRRETLGVVPPPVRRFINLGPRRRARPMQPHSIQFAVTGAATGQILADVSYRIILDNNNEYIGMTDSAGLTEVVGSDIPFTARIEAPYYDGKRTISRIDTNTKSNSAGTDLCSC